MPSPLRLAYTEPVTADPAEELARSIGARREAAGPLGQGMIAGTEGMLGGVSQYLSDAAEMLGYDPTSLRGYADERYREARTFAPKIDTYTKVLDDPTASNVIDYSLGMIGQGLPSVALGVAGGVLGRSLLRNPWGALPGAAAATFPMEAGETAGTLAHDPNTATLPVEERVKIASQKGVANSAIEMLGAPASIVRRIGGRAAKRGVVREVAAQMRNEALTEGAQEVVGLAAHSVADPSRNTAGDIEQVINSMIGGGLLGGGLGLAGGGANTAFQQARRVPGALEDAASRLNMGDGHESMRGATLDETLANIKRTDPLRPDLAAAVLRHPDIPDSVRQQFANADFTTPEAQADLGRAVAAYETGRRARSAIGGITKLIKRMLPKPSKPSEPDSTAPAPQMSQMRAPGPLLETLVSHMKPEVRKDMEIVRFLPKLAAELHQVLSDQPNANVTLDMLRRFVSSSEIQDMFADPGKLADELVGMTTSNSLGVRRFRASRVAEDDVGKEDSIFRSSLTGDDWQWTSALTNGDESMRWLARAIDDHFISGPGSKEKSKAFEGAMKEAFGANSDFVLDYYAQLHGTARTIYAPQEILDEGTTVDNLTEEDRADEDTTDYDARNQGINEQEEPKASYRYADPMRKIPFAKGAAAKDKLLVSGALGEDIKILVRPYSDVIAERGDSLTAGLLELLAKIELSKDEALLAAGERARKLYEQTSNEKRALDEFEVLEVKDRDADPFTATDEELHKMRVLIDVAHNTKDKTKAGKMAETAVNFIRRPRDNEKSTLGKNFKLSAESMWRTWQKKFPGNQNEDETKPKYVRRMFEEALSAVIARDDILGMSVDKDTGEYILSLPDDLVLSWKENIRLFEDREGRFSTLPQWKREGGKIVEVGRSDKPGPLDKIDEQLKEMQETLDKVYDEQMKEMKETLGEIQYGPGDRINQQQLLRIKEVGEDLEDQVSVLQAKVEKVIAKYSPITVRQAHIKDPAERSRTRMVRERLHKAWTKRLGRLQSMYDRIDSAVKFAQTAYIGPGVGSTMDIAEEEELIANDEKHVYEADTGVALGRGGKHHAASSGPVGGATQPDAEGAAALRSYGILVEDAIRELGFSEDLYPSPTFTGGAEDIATDVATDVAEDFFAMAKRETAEFQKLSDKQLDEEITKQESQNVEADGSVDARLQALKTTKANRAEGKPAGARVGRSHKPTPQFDNMPAHVPGVRTMSYAGIGSRKTPPFVLARMELVARELAKRGYTLTSGGALGADQAFEAGAGSAKQIFYAKDASPITRAVAREIHPNPGALGEFPLNLMARNTKQVFGADLKTPVDFVLAWTPDGAESTEQRSIKTGGTGQAIDMASRKGIPVINMAREGWENKLRQALNVAAKPAEKATEKAAAIPEFQGEHRFLSNFEGGPVEYEGATYKTVEHAYQAAKTMDKGERAAIAGASTPGQAKNLGRRVTMRPNWNAMRLGVMEALVRQKFAEPGMRAKLLSTAPRGLQEGNKWRDTFWGVDLNTGKGMNNLGKILMKVRDELSAERTQPKFSHMSRPVNPSPAAIETGNAAMDELAAALGRYGFKISNEARPHAVAVMEKYLSSPLLDRAGFLEEAADSLSYFIMAHKDAPELKTLIRELRGNEWSAAVASLKSQGKSRGEALIHAYRVVVARELQRGLAERADSADGFVAKLIKLVKDLIAVFTSTQTDAFAQAIRDKTNTLLEGSAASTPDGYKRMTLQGAVNADPHSAAVLTAIAANNKNVLLTGSIVLSTYGPIYRPNTAALHDLDLIVRDQKWYPAIKNDLLRAFPDSIQIYSFVPVGGYTVNTFLVPPKGATIKNRIYVGKKIHGYDVARGDKVVGSVRTENKTEIKRGETAALVDFFVFPSGYTEKGQRTVEFTLNDKKFSVSATSAAHIFASKMMLSRDKDVFDYSGFSIDPASAMRPGEQFSLQNGVGEALTQAQMDEVKAELMKLRGSDIKSAWDYSGLFEGKYTYEAGLRTITIAANSLHPMETAWHESMHDFMQMLLRDGKRALRESLLATASHPAMRNKLKRLLEGYPEAQEQLSDPNEALAYMFQFWAAGTLQIPTQARTWFQKIAAYFRGLLGIVSSSEQAVQILSALKSGRFANVNATAAVLDTMRVETLNDLVTRVAGPVKVTADKLMDSALTRLNTSGVPEYVEIANAFHQNPGGEGKPVISINGTILNLPFLQRRAKQNAQWLNKLGGIIEGATKEELTEAIIALQSHIEPTNERALRVKQGVRALFQDLYAYLSRAGVADLRQDEKGEWAWEGIHQVQEYFPRLWSPDALRKRRDEFLQVMNKYTDPTDALAIYNTLTGSGTGQMDNAENNHHMGFSPYQQAVKDRRLTFINKDNAHEFMPFMEKDIVQAVSTYIFQATHRAEYTRQFGNSGEWIRSKLKESEASGATQADLMDAAKTIRALEGTLNHDFNPTLRRLFNTALVYENIALLPFALFASLIDPLGIAVRTGDMQEAWKAFTAGMKGIVDSFKGTEGQDAQTHLAKLIGMIDDNNTLENVGALYNGMYMSPFLRKVNDTFFKWNGMALWNRRMRVAALSAGQRFLIKHSRAVTAETDSRLGDQTALPTTEEEEAQGQRYLDELGVKPGDIMPFNDGIAVTKDQVLLALQAHLGRFVGGQTTITNEALEKEAEEISERVQAALFKFVDSAILRPTSAHRPVWGSDPAWALVFHLKQFTYSFHNVILKRANHEMMHGNAAAMWMLASYVPFMIAADFVRGGLTGARTGWDFIDWLTNGVDRSGVLGTGTFFSDALQDAARGTVPGASFLGPTAGHAIDAIQTLAGAPNDSVSHLFHRSLPAGPVFKAVGL